MKRCFTIKCSLFVQPRKHGNWKKYRHTDTQTWSYACFPNKILFSHRTLCSFYFLFRSWFNKINLDVMYMEVTDYFDMVVGVLQEDTLASYLFIICLDYVFKTSFDTMKDIGFKLTKKRSRRNPAHTITDADYANDIALLLNTTTQAKTLLDSHFNAQQTE